MEVTPEQLAAHQAAMARGKAKREQYKAAKQVSAQSIAPPLCSLARARILPSDDAAAASDGTAPPTRSRVNSHVARRTPPLIGPRTGNTCEPKSMQRPKTGRRVQFATFGGFDVVEVTLPCTQASSAFKNCIQLEML